MADIRRPRWPHHLNGTGFGPSRQLPEAFRVRSASVPNSNPGIRRPRWGGVVEGVADTATPSRTIKGGKSAVAAVWRPAKAQVSGVAIDPPPNQLELV